MLETKCVGDTFEMLVTVLAISVTNILYLLTLALGTNIQKMSSRSSVASILKLSPTVSHHNVTNMTVAKHHSLILNFGLFLSIENTFVVSRLFLNNR